MTHSNDVSPEPQLTNLFPFMSPTLTSIPPDQTRPGHTCSTADAYAVSIVTVLHVPQAPPLAMGIPGGIMSGGSWAIAGLSTVALWDWDLGLKDFLLGLQK